MLVSRRSSPYDRIHEPQLYSSSARRCDFRGRLDGVASEAIRFATIAALRELRAELNQLDGSVTRVEGSLARGVDAKEQQSKIGRLELELGELRKSSHSRFEALADTLAAVEGENYGLSMCCGEIRERMAALEEALEEARRVARAQERSRYCSPEPDAYAASRRPSSTYDYQESWMCTPEREVSPLPAKAAQSRPGTLERGALPVVPLWSDSPERPSRRRSISPTRAAQNTRVRSRPARRGRCVPPDRAAELDQAPELSAAVSRPPRTAHGYFFKPAWAVELQAQPLPEAQDFAILVDAIRTLFKRLQRNNPGLQSTNVLMDNSVLVQQLKQLDPLVFQRHGKQLWREYVPLAQRFVRLQLMLPPSELGLGTCRNEFVLIESIERPWNAKVAHPPSFDAQVALLRRQINSAPKSWAPQYSSVPPEPSSEPPEPVVQLPEEPEPIKASASFPPLPRTLEPEWEERLYEPSAYHELVDVLLELTQASRQTELYLDAVQQALRSRMGDESYYELMDACGSAMPFFVLAARFVRIAKVPHRKCLRLLDVRHPSSASSRTWTTLRARESAIER